MNTRCDICGRQFWQGPVETRVEPLAADDRYCTGCAAMACEAFKEAERYAEGKATDAELAAAWDAARASAGAAPVAHLRESVANPFKVTRRAG